MYDFSKVLLPKNVNPGFEAFEKLGFIFKDYDDNFMYASVIPENWNIIMQNDQIIIIDNFNRTRAICENNVLILLPKYNVCVKTNKSETDLEVFFGNDTEIIHGFGIVTLTDNASEDEINSTNILISKLVNRAMAYADENYPKWTDPTAYWEEKSYVRTKKSEI